MSDEVGALDDGAEHALSRGASIISDYVRRLPNQAGVYRMVDAHGEVLYVGKASNLQKRVQAYTKIGDLSIRIARMVALTASMEFVQTASEAEALLLEANLIKRYRPRYNILLRDDKSFPYILVARDHEAPQLLKHRGAKKRKGDYFGPFASAGAVARTLNTLQRAFWLRSCSDSVFASRTRPCLLYQIKRCAAPCVGKVSPEDYLRLVEQANLFLRGQSDVVKTELTREMEAAAATLDFERAARLRDRVRSLAHVQGQQGINPQFIDEADLFAAYEEAGTVCVQVFFFRGGQNWGNRAYFPRHDKQDDIAQVLESFIGQFYDERDPPKLVLCSHVLPLTELMGEALTAKLGSRVEVACPQRGEKREVMQQALINAREAIARRLAESSSQRGLLEGLASVFGLAAPPRRIEIFDNSHISGTHAIGAMVVAGAEGFVKREYRKFNIKSTTLTPGDDYAMMREVLSRRFARLASLDTDRQTEGGVSFDVSQATNDADDVVMPDLVIIDGGAGQLKVALEVLKPLGFADVAVVAIAKGEDRDAGREKFFMEEKGMFQLEFNSPVLFFLQRLRDEAHRFAIATHRGRRANELTASPLDSVEGIGPRRKRALLNHFGSGKAVTRAGLSDLEAVKGISKELARKIYDHFHEKN